MFPKCLRLTYLKNESIFFVKVYTKYILYFRVESVVTKDERPAGRKGIQSSMLLPRWLGLQQRAQLVRWFCKMGCHQKGHRDHCV